MHAVTYHGDDEEQLVPQGQSYIMEMVKSSNDTDHLTTGHCLSIDDQCMTNVQCDKGACSQISRRWRRTVMIYLKDGEEQ